ncbi:MAG TPA: 50S ribosomal protein L22 [Phycisphaerales bacterium]|nr:50S ribosomal protein L22 [Phycisphaerales bacterium]
MKINPDKLKKRAKKAGVTVEQLAEALPRKHDRQQQLAHCATKVRNWMRGNDHPKVTPKDAEALAKALSCDTKDIVRFQSRAKFQRTSARKARLLADLIRGRRVDEALTMLEFHERRASVMVWKALNAARSDAEAADASIDRLVVTESRVDSAATIKRFQPKDRGRAHPIKKRTSHIVIGVEEVA